MGQKVVEIAGLVADQMREHLALVPARQIGAGRGRRQVELRCVTRMLGHVSSSGLRSSRVQHRAAEADRQSDRLRGQYVRADWTGWVRP